MPWAEFCYLCSAYLPTCCQHYKDISSALQSRLSYGPRGCTAASRGHASACPLLTEPIKDCTPGHASQPRHTLGRYGTDGLLLAGRGCSGTMCCTPYCCPRLEVNCACWLVSQHRSHPSARLREAHGGAGCVRGGSMRSALKHTCQALHRLSYRRGPGPGQSCLTKPDQRGSTLHMQSCWPSAPRRRHNSAASQGATHATLSPSAARARSQQCA